MGLADRLEAARTLLSQEGWAAVLVLAGASLLVAPPTAGGAILIGHVAGVMLAAFVVVFVATRLLAVVRS